MAYAFSFFAAFCLLFACENIPSPTKGNLTPPGAQVIQGSELLEALEGYWQNERDPALLLRVQGEKMQHIRDNQVTEECVLEAFSDCGNAPCEAEEVSNGWCFTEKNANGLQCNRVLQCDSLLQFKTAGKTDIFKFRKVGP